MTGNEYQKLAMRTNDHKAKTVFINGEFRSRNTEDELMCFLPHWIKRLILRWLRRRERG